MTKFTSIMQQHTPHEGFSPGPRMDPLAPAVVDKSGLELDTDQIRGARALKWDLEAIEPLHPALRVCAAMLYVEIGNGTDVVATSLFSMIPVLPALPRKY
jgi:hypothetical protein